MDQHIFNFLEVMAILWFIFLPVASVSLVLLLIVMVINSVVRWVVKFDRPIDDVLPGSLHIASAQPVSSRLAKVR